MFPTPPRNNSVIKQVAYKMGIDPKVASKTWSTMSSYSKNVTDNFSKSRTKLSKRGLIIDNNSSNYSYQRIATSSSMSSLGGIDDQNAPKKHTKSNAPKFALYCLVCVAIIWLLHELTRSKTLKLTEPLSHMAQSNGSHIDIHINYDEGLPALMDGHGAAHAHLHDQELNHLFNQINNAANGATNNDTTVTPPHTIHMDEDPNLEEKSFQSLRDNNDPNLETDSVDKTTPHDDDILQLSPNAYHAYPTGFSNPSKGVYYLAMIADMDTSSKMSKYRWRSYLQHIKLTLHDYSSKKLSHSKTKTKIRVKYEYIAPPFEYDADSVKLLGNSTVILDGYYNEKGRGMELSELLITDDRRMYAFDDRTGIVYEISQQFQAIPRHIIPEGDGNEVKGMKIEWATYKPDEGRLYIGSIGREYTNSDGSSITKLSLLWVATIDAEGRVQHHDWTDRYMKLREVTGTLFPGYLWIEAVEWSVVHGKWFILPRYVSFDRYDHFMTEHRGCNLLIVASENFENVQLVWIKFDTPHGQQLTLQEESESVVEIDIDDDNDVSESKGRKILQSEDEDEDGEQDQEDVARKMYKTVHDLSPHQLRSMSVKQENMRASMQHSTKGFSSMKFLPGTNDTMVVALQTQEENGEIVDSYLTVFDINGNVYLQPETIILHHKYEGIVVL